MDEFLANLRVLGVMALFALAVGGLQAALGTNCSPFEGVLYYAVFTGGTIPWIAAVCVVVQTAVHRNGLRYLVVYGIVGVSIARALWWLYSQPAIQVYEPFIGWFAGSIYDEALSSMTPHLIYRVWTTAIALSCILVLDGVVTDRGFRVPVLVVSACVVFGVWGARGELGLERSRSWIVEQLAGHVQTAHFDIYFDASATTDRQLRQLVYDHEARFAELTAFFGTHPPERLTSFVYANREQKGQMMGGRNTLVAKIWLSEMHIVWDGAGDSMLAHEMAHLFLRDDGSGPLSLSSRWRLFPVMALVEGAAGAAEWSSTDLDEHAWSAAMYRLDLGERISELLGPTGFWAAPSGRAYTLTSSFSRWLIAERGAESFRRAYGRGAFEEEYGVPLTALEDDWREYLEGYPLDENMLALAEYRFDRPSIFGRRCARQAATRLTEGDEFMRRRNYESARQCYEALLRFDPENAGYQLAVAGRVRQMGELDEAIEIASGIAAREGFGRTRVSQARELVADILWESGDPSAANLVYTELLVNAFAHSERRRLMAKQWGTAQRDERPELSALMRDVFAATDDGGENHAARMVDAWHRSGEPWTAYLAGLWLASSEPALAVEFLSVDAIGDLPPEVELRALQSLATALWSTENWSRACEVWTRVGQTAVDGTQAAADAGVWRGRCGSSLRPPAGLENLGVYGSDTVP
jgi:tetratricopeptide (TPR) repeat protein